MFDPREDAINAAVATLLRDYDPHYMTLDARNRMETRLFLARYDALMCVPKPNDLREQTIPIVANPIPMILFCPSCGIQHIDAEEPHKSNCNYFLGSPGAWDCSCGRWTNPPHKSHLCGYCQHVWRPADVHTTGVTEILTRGKTDTPDPVRRVIDRMARFQNEQADRNAVKILRDGGVTLSTSGACPHGYVDHDQCPDCCH